MSNILLFLEANTTGSGMLALQKARQMGFRPVFLTNNPGHYLGLEESPAEVIRCNTNNLASVQAAIQNQVGLAHLRGITTTSDFYVEMVAALSSVFNLPGNPLESLHVCRNKALTRARLAAARIRQPLFLTVRAEKEAKIAVKKLGLPCVVKPADDSGSNNVKLCYDEEEVVSLVAHILSLEENMRGQPIVRTVLLEQFIDAPEYSVEMFSHKGNAICIGITEKKLTGLPFFVEARHIFPAPLASQIQEEIILTVQKALEAVGFQNGPTHTEVKLTREGCSIIEINARLAGGMIPELIQYAAGIDMLEAQICMASQQKIVLDRKYHQSAGIQFVVAEKEGVFCGIEGVSEVEQLSSVKRVAITYKRGQRMRCPQNAYDRLGYVIVAANTYGETEQALAQAVHMLGILGQR